MARRRWNLGKWKRDSILFTFALTVGGYETVFGGGRASVYTFAVAILLSPFVLRAEDPKE